MHPVPPAAAPIERTADAATAAAPAPAAQAPAVSTELLQQSLGLYFAPWVQQLQLRVEAFDGDSVTLRLPHSQQLSRVGGTLCGQAVMAAADTAMVLALIAHFGTFRPCTTVQLATSFLRPIANQDALVEARVLRAGRSLAFGEIDIRGAADGRTASRASTTYALL